LETWNHIYEHFNPVAFHIFGIGVHWYGMMYVLALVSALAIGKYFLNKWQFEFTAEQLDKFFIYIEIGIILGARIGYILFYDPNTLYYLAHPWQIFNPFNHNGEFIGIRGMSYHGAVIGFFTGSYLFYKKYHVSFGRVMDLVAISVPLAYVFGRIGNFLNQELIGRATDVPWGIYVDGVLRHPSQLYEAFLEGICVFIVVYLWKKIQRFDGELILVYGGAYGIFRGIAESFRAPDPQIGYLCCNFVTLGMVLSLSMTVVAVVLWFYFKRKVTLENK